MTEVQNKHLNINKIIIDQTCFVFMQFLFLIWTNVTGTLTENLQLH